VLADKLICPVVVLTNTSPAVELKVPALDPAGNVGIGLVPFEQYGPA
jgi:hypothetical protein